MMNPRTEGAPHHYLHLTPEELEALPPDELLQARLEYHSLLLAMMGILSTPEIGFTMRTVALDLMYLQTQRSSRGEIPTRRHRWSPSSK